MIRIPSCPGIVGSRWADSCLFCENVTLDAVLQKGSAVDPEPQVKLEDVLPLAFTRLCEPKEASYSLIRKYVSQYYPKLRVDIRY